MSFKDARSFCGKRFPKGDLAKIDTTDKIRLLKELFISSFGKIV